MYIYVCKHYTWKSRVLQVDPFKVVTSRGIKSHGPGCALRVSGIPLGSHAEHPCGPQWKQGRALALGLAEPVMFTTDSTGWWLGGSQGYPYIPLKGELRSYQEC